MISRRNVLITASVGLSTTLAGCGTDSGSEPTQEEADNAEETEESAELQTLESFSVAEIRSFSHTFSDGLSVTVELTNETEGGSGENRANVSMDVYVEEELVGEDNEWNRAGSDGRTATYDLSVEAVSPGGDVSLEDVTEVRIVGSEPGSADIELERFSGDEIRTKIE